MAEIEMNLSGIPGSDYHPLMEVSRTHMFEIREARGKIKSRAFSEYGNDHPAGEMPAHHAIERARYVYERNDTRLLERIDSDRSKGLRGEIISEKERIIRERLNPPAFSGRMKFKIYFSMSNPAKSGRYPLAEKNDALPGNPPRKIKIRDLGAGPLEGINACVSRMELDDSFINEKGDTIHLTGYMESHGKGYTKKLARKSGVMEMMERYHGTMRYGKDREGIHVYSMDELMKSGDKFLPPDVFFNCIFPPLNSDRLEWMEAENMMTGETVLAPAPEIYYFMFPLEGVYNPVTGETTGLAAGDEYRDAEDHAVKERVERDADALFKATPELFVRVINDSLPGKTREIVRNMEENGMDVSVKVGYTDVLPYYIRADILKEGNLVGQGMRYDPNPLESARGALSEAAMALLANPYRDSILSGMINKKDQSLPEQTLDFQRLADMSGEDQMGDIKQSLKDVGLDLYVTRLHEKDGMYVVRVLSPFAFNPADRSLYGSPKK